MHEPIREVPNTKVIMCISRKTEIVARNAATIEIKIEPAEKMTGFGLLKTKIKIAITTSIEIVAIIEISRAAAFEL